MIAIKINNKPYTFSKQCTLAQAIKAYGVKETIFAVAINGVLVPKAYFEQTVLAQNMIIDIIIPMQGG